MKKALALATVALLAGSLTACGGNSSPSADGSSGGNGGITHSPGSPTQSSTNDGGGSGLGGGGDYCAALREAKTEFQAFSTDKLTDSKYSFLQSKVSEIEASAPSSVKGDWDVLSQTLEKYKELLNSAGLSFDDLSGMQNGQLPPGVDVQQLQKVAKELVAYTKTHNIEKATEDIQKNAQAQCGVNLNK